MRSLVYQFVRTASVQLFSKVLAVFLGVIYARILGPEDYGYYGYVLSIVTVLSVPVVNGLPNLIVREVAIHKSNMDWPHIKGMINWSRTYVVICSFFIILTTYLGLMLFSMEFIVFALLLIPIRGILSQQGAFLNGFKHPALSQLPLGVINPIITILFISILFFFNITMDTDMVIRVVVTSSFIAIFISYFFLKSKLSSYNYCIAKYKVRFWNLSLLPFSMLSFIIIINSEFATIFLGFIGDKENVAYFKVAFQAVFVCTFGLSSINAVIMPQLASLVKSGDFYQAQELLTRSVRLSVCVALPIMTCLILGGDYFIKLVFGSNYTSSYGIMVVLCFGQFFNIFLGPVGSVLYMTGNEKVALKISAFCFFVNVILISTLSLEFNGIGAAVAVSISMALSNIIMSYMVYKKTKLKTWIK